SCTGIEKDLTFTGSGGEIADRTLPASGATVSDLVFIWRDALEIFDGAGNSIGVRSTPQQVAFCEPYLSVGQTDGAITISYDSYNAQDVTLDYGPTTTYGTRLSSSASNRNRFHLSSLTPGQMYHYRITEGTHAGPDYTFRA